MYVMKFGLLAPTLNADVADEQLWLAHKYRNDLVRVERDKRAMIRAAEAPYGIAALLEQVKQASIEKDKDAASEIRKQIEVLRTTPALVEELARISGAKNTEKSKTSAQKRATKTPNNSVASKMLRAVRASCGVYWGTYLLVERAHGVSCAETAIYDGGEPSDPSFRRWDGEGQLAVQIQSSRPLVGDGLFGDDPRVSIAPVDVAVLAHGTRSQRRMAARTTLRLRVGGGRTDPVWAEWPMLLHRPIPPTALIKWVAVSRRKIGPRTVWSCEITLSDPRKGSSMPYQIESESREQIETGGGTVAVVFGWRRKHGNKVRVAQWMTTTGETGVLDLSDTRVARCPTSRDIECDGGRGGVIDGIRKANDIRAIRDRKFNDVKAMLIEWLRTLPEVPEWIRKCTTRSETCPTSAQAIAYIAQWRAPSKLAALTRAARCPANRDTCPHIADLEAWRYHDVHLWAWERSQETSARRRRTEVYRRFAAMLTGRFARLLVDGTDYKQLKDRRAKGAERGAKRPQTMAQLVAVGELREKVKCAASMRGVVFEKVAPCKSGMRCPQCGTTDKAHKGDGMYACSHCGYARDVSTTRLLNMLADDGYGAEVEAIIKRGDKMITKLEQQKVA